MKRILLLTTGGTIASVPGEEGLAPGLEPEQLLTFVPERAKRFQITACSLLSFDSTNLQPEHWVLIAKEVFAALKSYDGIVITHGTDTMAYTAAALSFMLPGLPLPVVLTGAQVPLTEPHSDGKQNLADALRVAAAGRPGVFLVFNGRIIRGCRASKINTRERNAFASINYPLEGTVQLIFRTLRFSKDTFQFYQFLEGVSPVPVE